MGFVIFAEEPSAPPKLAGWILFALMLTIVAAGAWLGVTSVTGLVTVYRSHVWDSVPCVVTSGSMSPPRRSVPNLTWMVMVMCTYQKEGQYYSVNRSPHAFGSNVTDASAALAELRAYGYLLDARFSLRPVAPTNRRSRRPASALALVRAVL
jgi:hypothetical protein